MNRLDSNNIENTDAKVQENIANWQSSENSLAPLTDGQIDLVYEISDIVSNLYIKNNEDVKISNNEKETPLIINKPREFIDWMISVEKDVQHDNLKEYQQYYESLTKHNENCKQLFNQSDATLNSLNQLKEEYENVTQKTNYLHNLSEQLMAHQRILKEKKVLLNGKLKHFTYFGKCQENIERLGTRINTSDCVSILDSIDESITYLNNHLQYRESRIYKMKYESILNTLLNEIFKFVNNIITETMKQVIDPDFKAHLLPQTANGANLDSAFSLYYGKFQSASTKARFILSKLEERQNKNEQYKSVLNDCQKTFLDQRLSILSTAVSKALNELKENHKSDKSVLFRSCCLFTMKVCLDEAMCFNYFFSTSSDYLNGYLTSLCQHLYDTLRPSLITINHIEILSEICGILKGEMLNDKVVSSEQIVNYVEVIKQLLEDVEERLVFRTSMFFQSDLIDFKPSPGDLAYPEKLIHMENIAMEIGDRRPDSRNSIGLEAHEVAQINKAQMAHFRSHTGNSPADLHGMWYPTVKRTLVCLSRLYFCLGRDTFQGLAQEALVICIKTIQRATDLICTKKSSVDGRLFQIKHLLIIREQIAPFQVDFTVKEMSLDFSGIHKAAVTLIQHRNDIFKFGSNNALLEFLLEGTPKVKEYLVDSRKEIDKELKHSCEAFISHVTFFLIGNVMAWVEKAEHILRIIQAENSQKQDLTVAGQDFGLPQIVAKMLVDAQKNMKAKIPEIQRSMQLYLSNRETEFILFRPVKNNIINAFMRVDQVLIKGGYSDEDQLMIGCPSPEQINILICSVSLSNGQDNASIDDGVSK